jgi:single-stranded DNA-binding protein
MKIQPSAPTALADDLCCVNLMGNLVNAPDIRIIANANVAIAQFILATHTSWLDKSTQQMKQWTTYHTIKAIGNEYELILRFADKGDVAIVQGCVVNDKTTEQPYILADFVRCYAKGKSRELNEFRCTGKINSDIKVNKTMSDKSFAEFTIEQNFHRFSPLKSKKQHFQVERLVHVWGMHAEQLASRADQSVDIWLEGRLNYQQNASKNAFIDVKNLLLLPHNK